jgi:hypothetical protein
MDPNLASELKPEFKPQKWESLFKASITASFNELSISSQVVLSTHTPMLARSLPDKSLRYIQINDDKSREILIGGDETNKLFSKALGILPDNSVKIFIGIEGPNDIAFLKNISKVLIRDGEAIPDLEKMELNGELIFFPI